LEISEITTRVSWSWVKGIVGGCFWLAGLIGGCIWLAGLVGLDPAAALILKFFESYKYFASSQTAFLKLTPECSERRKRDI
jgi:hypothetical protein